MRTLFPSIFSSIVAACILFCPSVLGAQPLTPVPIKQIAAPPSDMVSGLLTLPDPATIPVVSRSALVPVKALFNEGQWTWSMPISVQQRGARIALLPADIGAWSAKLTAPDQSSIPARLNAPPDKRVHIGTDALAWVAQDRDFTHLSIQPNNQGAWVLTITSDHEAAGFILIDSGPEIALSTHVTTLSTLQNQPITLESKFSNAVRLTSLTAEVTSPSGRIMTELAPAGASQVTFFPDEAGSHSVRMIAQGIDLQGEHIFRTTQHLIDAAQPAPLIKSPTVTTDDNHVFFAFAPTTTTRRTILAAEVWGRRDGVLTPVAWISTIVGSTRALTLDARWIALAEVDPGTLELRAVRLHDINSFVLLEIIDRIPVPIQRLTLPQAPDSITPDMLTGTFKQSVPSRLPPQITQSAGPGHRLMLIHGYCTDANPYPVSHFTGDLAVFEDFNQSRSHDEFALNLLAQSAPMKSFGVVAHSQGGIASLHLLNFYWSGLDWARGGNRLIQTVGSPYQGTALAGNAAVLGDIFGFGCGENESLSYSGSASWLSLIPSAPRQQVYYHTTSFEDGFGFDYCNIITDLLLSDPDDGVIERSAGQLPSANNMGHLEGWCHTTGMRDPAQCTDHARNSIMNQEAKR